LATAFFATALFATVSLAVAFVRTGCFATACSRAGAEVDVAGEPADTGLC